MWGERYKSFKICLLIFLIISLVIPSFSSAKQTNFILPTKGKISFHFGQKYKHPKTGKFLTHRGIDITNSEGAQVFASSDGVVSFAGLTPAEGKTISIKHSNGLTTTYGNLSSILIIQGKRVRQGEKIGLVGSGFDASSPSPHLHFGVKIGKIYLDPEMILSGEFKGISGLFSLAPLPQKKVEIKQKEFNILPEIRLMTVKEIGISNVKNNIITIMKNLWKNMANKLWGGFKYLLKNLFIFFKLGYKSLKYSVSKVLRYIQFIKNKLGNFFSRIYQIMKLRINALFKTLRQFFSKAINQSKIISSQLKNFILRQFKVPGILFSKLIRFINSSYRFVSSKFLQKFISSIRWFGRLFQRTFFSLNWYLKIFKSVRTIFSNSIKNFHSVFSYLNNRIKSMAKIFSKTIKNFLPFQKYKKFLINVTKKIYFNLRKNFYSISSYLNNKIKLSFQFLKKTIFSSSWREMVLRLLFKKILACTEFVVRIFIYINSFYSLLRQKIYTFFSGGYFYLKKLVLNFFSLILPLNKEKVASARNELKFNKERSSELFLSDSRFDPSGEKNRMKDKVSITYYLRESSVIKLYIADRNKKVIKELINGKKEEISNNSGKRLLAVWDGLDCQGNIASEGFYRICLDVASLNKKYHEINSQNIEVVYHLD